jgi:small-conductance mechanosensitive channel
MPEWANQQLLISIGIVVGSLLGGLIVQKLLIERIRVWVERTVWKWDDAVINALGRMPLLWCICGGAYGALLFGKPDAPVYVLTIKVLVSVVVITSTLVAARLVGSAIDLWSSRGGTGLSSTTLFGNATRLVIYIVGVLLLLANLGVEITPLVAGLGLGGLAVALALEETLNNLFSGVQIIASQLVRPGDYVKLESGYEGYVTDVKARNTTIRSFPDQNRIIVPNSVLASSIVINYSLPEKNLWVDLDIGVSYDSDLERVEQITLEVARQIIESVEGGISDHDPVLRYQEFGDSSINFNVRMFVSEFRDKFTIIHEFIKALHKRYDAEGIEIPFPIRTIYTKDAAPATPPAQTKKKATRKSKKT